MSPERTELTELTFSELSGKALDARLITQFNRALGLDLALSEFMTEANVLETEFTPEFAEAVDFVSSLVKRTMLKSFLDVIDYGSTEMIRQTVEVLEVIERFRRGEIPGFNISIGVEKPLKDIIEFTKNVQGIDYENRYLRFPKTR